MNACGAFSIAVWRPTLSRTDWLVRASGLSGHRAIRYGLSGGQKRPSLDKQVRQLDLTQPASYAMHAPLIPSYYLE